MTDLLALLRTTAFRWTLRVTLAFTLVIGVLFGFIYWQTAWYEENCLDRYVATAARSIRDGSPRDAVQRVEAWLAQDQHNVRFVGLFAIDGRKLAGNVSVPPENLPPDGQPRRAIFPDIDGDGDDPEMAHAVAMPLADGQLLVLAHDTDELEEIRSIVLRALSLFVLPAFGLALFVGALLGCRAQRRIRTVHSAIERVMAGSLGERLPDYGSDYFGHLVASVNNMLACVEALLNQVRGIGDSIDHDLRTPLTRVRARLERSRNTAATQADFHDALDRSLVWIDQTLAIITAVLRIGEIEYGQRRAHFGAVDLAPLVAELADLFGPMAEDKDVAFEQDLNRVPAIVGDRDLLFEAIGNLVENAIKYTPSGEHVRLALHAVDNSVRVRVQDTGPGIPPGERDRVLWRFYRCDASRHIDGSGLGLSRVAAVATLHGFTLHLHGTAGCIADFCCRVPEADRKQSTAAQLEPEPDLVR